jgi:hypothetical protein
MFRLNHGQLLDLEGKGRREGRSTYPELVAVHVRVEFTLDERRQFLVEK